MNCMKLIKNKIIKEIPDNLVAIYLNMGWVQYKEPAKERPFEFKKSAEKSKEKEFKIEE